MTEFFVWCRDKGGSFVLTSWLYIILWGIVAAAFSTLLYMDGKFSRSLADGASINPLAFQVMGWCFRFFAVVFLMAVARNVHKGISKGRTFQVLGVLVSIIVCAHAVGIGLEALDDKKDRALSVQTTVTAQTDGIQVKLEALEQQKAGIRADLAATKSSNQAAIDNITSDGINNDELADVYRQDNADADKAARERIAAIDAAEIELLTQSATVNTDSAANIATADKWSPLFVGMAQMVTFDKEPSDWAIYLCGVFFIVFWVFVAESLVIFVPPAVYKMHLADADAAPDKDPVRVEAGKKAANTKKRRKRQSEKIEQQAESYMSHYKHALRLARNTNWTAEGIASNAFKLPAGGMEDRLNLMVRADLIPQEDVELIMRRAEKPEGKQNAVDDINAPLQLTNGEDKGDADDTADNTSAIS